MFLLLSYYQNRILKKKNLIQVYCAIRKNPMLHINKYFFNQGGALRQVRRRSQPQPASDPPPPLTWQRRISGPAYPTPFLGSNSLVSERRGAFSVSTKCCGRQACSELREGECGATRGRGQLIRPCLKGGGGGVGGCRVDRGHGRVGRYALAESRPEETSDR